LKYNKKKQKKKTIGDNEKGKHLPFDDYIDGSKRNSMWLVFRTLQKGTGYSIFLRHKKTSGIPLCNNKYQICVLIYQILTFSQLRCFYEIWLFLLKRRIPNIIYSLNTRVCVFNLKTKCANDLTNVGISLYYNVISMMILLIILGSCQMLMLSELLSLFYE
jgi:hypothetical protein